MPTTSDGWINLSPDVLGRRDPPVAAGEREMLESWLEFHRSTLLTKCDGLTSEQLKVRSVPPSSLSLIGLVRHLTQVERNWFRSAFTADNVDPVHAPDAEFDAEGADISADLARYGAEVEHSRRIAAQCADLDTVGAGVRDGRHIAPSLRWIYLHMIEEYARHNGHADLLRERIDGAVGV